MKFKKLAFALAASALSSTSQAALVANWDFEEGTGTTTKELVSNTSSAAFGTGVTWSIDTPGIASSSSLSFPGTGAGNVRTSLNAATVGINGTGAKTITAWFKAGDTATVTRMFFGWTPNNGSGGGTEIRLGLDGNGFLRFEATSGNAVYNTIALDDNAWHMVGLVVDASDSTSIVQFYVDGTLANPTSSGNVAINTTGTSVDTLRNDISLGIGNQGGTQQWSGLLDDVRIYNTALSKTELDGIKSAMAIPEPSSALLGGLGLLALLRRRRA